MMPFGAFCAQEIKTGGPLHFLASHSSLIENIHISLRNPLSKNSKKVGGYLKNIQVIGLQLENIYTHTAHVHSQKYAHIPIMIFLKKHRRVDGRIAECFTVLDTHEEDLYPFSTSTWKPTTNSEYSSWQLKTYTWFI